MSGGIPGIPCIIGGGMLACAFPASGNQGNQGVAYRDTEGNPSWEGNHSQREACRVEDLRMEDQEEQAWVAG